MRIGAFPTFRRLMDRMNARKSWEQANPEIAAEWNAALLDDDAFERAKEIVQKQAEASNGAALARLGLPRPILRALRAPKPSPALVAAKEWWLTGKPVLLLRGGVGSGKTFAGAWVLLRQLEREAVAKRPSGGSSWDAAMFCTAPEFNGLSDYHPEARAWMERLCRCGVLVLDDLGTERMGDGELSCVQRVIGARHAGERRTVITSNLSADLFKARYGERVADRIREVGLVRDSGTTSLRGFSR